MTGARGAGRGARAPVWRGVIETYRAHLPVSPKTPVITLLEGNTPLVFSPTLSRRVGRHADVYLKYEGMNPTGSFKDRGMTVAISKAVEAHSTASDFASFALEMATVMPRSLKEPVGLVPSYLRYTVTRRPACRLRVGLKMSGVLPSSSVTTGVAGDTGKWLR